MKQLIGKGLTVLSVLLVAFVAMAIVTPQAHAYSRDCDGLDTEDTGIFTSNPADVNGQSASFNFTYNMTPDPCFVGDTIQFEVWMTNDGDLELYDAEIELSGYTQSVAVLYPGDSLYITETREVHDSSICGFYYTGSALYSNDPVSPQGITDMGSGYIEPQVRSMTVNYYDKTGSILSTSTVDENGLTLPAYSGTVGSSEAFDCWTIDPSHPTWTWKQYDYGEWISLDELGQFDDNMDGEVDFYPVFRTVTPTISVNKEIDVPSSVDLTGLTYTFDFQAAAPVQGELSAFAVPAGVDIPTVTLTAANSTLVTGSDSVRNLTGSVNLPDPNLFGHAGVYAFTVTESVSGANAGDSWDNDRSVYKVRLYVVNDGNGGLAYADGTNSNNTSAYTIELINDIDGQTTSSKPGQMTFLNIYDKLTDLTVTKAVSGDYANRTKEFAFDLVIDLPDYVADKSYAYTVGGVSATATAVEHVITISNFTLSADETLSFSNVLPVGSTYTLVEKDPTDGVNNYVPTASYTYAGIGAANSGYETATTDVAAGTAGGANYTVAQTSAASPNGNTALGAALGNAVTVTNTLNNPPSPTGVLISILPFALMLAVPAILGAAAIKGRRRDEEIYF